MTATSTTERYESNGQVIYRSNIKVTSIPEKSIWDYVVGDIKLDDDQLAFKVCNKKGDEISYGALKREALQIGIGLREKAKLKPGDVVLFFLGNNLHFPILLFACLFAGLRVSFANPMYTSTELRHITNVLKPKRYFTSGSLFRKLIGCGALAKDIVLVDTAPLGFSIGHIAQLKVPADQIESARPYQPKDMNETAFLPWSSGTTGLPKAIEITHKNVVSMVCALLALPDMYHRGDRTIVALPFFHAIGLIGGIIANTVLRAQAYIHTPFHPVEYAKLVKQYSIGTITTVPPMLKAISEVPQATAENFRSLRWISCGAAPLDATLQAKISKKLGTLVVQGHGQTETTIAAFGLSLNMKPGTVGYIIPGVEARLVDDDERDVKHGERGEILLRGPNITKGYYLNDEANKSTFTSDGWLKTGDVAVLDNDQQLTIVDRKKELIKYKGFQVAPAELEALLLQHPSIIAAGVVGLYSQDEATELPRAYIQLRPDVTRNDNIEKAIQQWVKGKVSNAKQLRGGVKVIERVPTNPSGKILRKELRKLVEQESKGRDSKL